MPYVKPDAVVAQMVQAGALKSRLPVRDRLKSFPRSTNGCFPVTVTGGW